ncbi:MAG: hypothetical protein ABI614_24720, partial [Planctomycetota bacterium]
DREATALSSLRGRLNSTDVLKRDIIKLLLRRIEIHPDEVRRVYKVPQNPFERSPATSVTLAG